MIDLQCPHCQTDYRLKPELAGRKVQCQNCSHKFRVSEVAHKILKADIPAGSEKIEIRCPRCLADYKLAQKYLGRRVRCKDCREEFRVTDPNQQNLVGTFLDSELPSDIATDSQPRKSKGQRPSVSQGETSRGSRTAPISRPEKQEFQRDIEGSRKDSRNSQYELLEDDYGNQEIELKKRKPLEPIVLGTPGLPMNPSEASDYKLPPRASIGGKRMSAPKQMGFVAAFLVAFFSLFMERLKRRGFRSAFRYAARSADNAADGKSKPVFKSVQDTDPSGFPSSVVPLGSPAPEIAYAVKGLPIGNLEPYRKFYLTQIENLNKVADELTELVDRSGSDERFRRIFSLRDLIKGYLNNRPPGLPPNAAEQQSLAKDLGEQVHKAMDRIFMQFERLQKSKMMEPGLAWDLKRIEEDTLEFEKSLTDYGDLPDPKEFVDVIVKNLRTEDDLEFLKVKMLEASKTRAIKSASKPGGEARITLWPVKNPRSAADSFWFCKVLKQKDNQIWLDAGSVSESAVADWKKTRATDTSTTLGPILGVKARKLIFSVPQQNNPKIGF